MLTSLVVQDEGIPERSGGYPRPVPRGKLHTVLGGQACTEISFVVREGGTLHASHTSIVCRFPSLPGGGVSDTPLGNQGRSCFRPHVAKSYFEPYKSYDQMQNFRPLSQKFSEISRFEKFEFLRFCLTLTHRNYHNSLNF